MRSLLPVLLMGLLPAAALPAVLEAAEPQSGSPAAEGASAVLTLDDRAFGAPLHLEAMPGRTPEAARAALQAAAAAVHEVEAASDPGAGALAALNAGAGSGPQQVSAHLFATLTRALGFCRWSEGIHGPLGAGLYELWGLRVPRAALPGAQAVEDATAAAACGKLTLDGAASTATLAAGSRVDLWGFATGAAVDRAFEVLASRGVRDASVTLGAVQRAVGDGPEGRGWPLRVGVPASLALFTAKLMLRGQSFAIASAGGRSLRAGAESWAPWLDQRRGRPTTGVIAAVAISELGLDAEGLAGTLFVAGSRRGSLLLGSLRPQPSVLWVLGDGTGEPLVTDWHWGGRLRQGGA
jgi:thiamine biosynthesis lipoprotein ApbE